MAPNSHMRQFTKMHENDDALAEALSKTARNGMNGTVNQLNQLRPLSCAAQDYAWGRLGSSSTVARMKDAQAQATLREMFGMAAGRASRSSSVDSTTLIEGGDDIADDLYFEIDEATPYAELWLGTHPSGMSMVTVPKKEYRYEDTCATEQLSLLRYVQEHGAMHCGSALQSNNEADLSFLLKILSVRKVLSIQAHPDKTLAEHLHATRPHIYKDPNHKPEMAIAISEKVRAMIGFRPITEISQHLYDYPEFCRLFETSTVEQMHALAASASSIETTTEQDADRNRQCLSDMFRSYLQAPTALIDELVETMVDRIKAQKHQPMNDVQKLILQLNDQYPGDCGIFAPLMLNVAELRTGQGLFIPANEPHAYISGEMIECMACSDNVVRAGLTPKLKDVDTLVNMLTYHCCEPAITDGEQVDDTMVRYSPPVDDFCVEWLRIKPNETYTLTAVDSPAVLLCLDGSGQLQQDATVSLYVDFGLAAFCSAQTTTHIVAGQYGLQIVRACTNVYRQQQQQQG